MMLVGLDWISTIRLIPVRWVAFGLGNDNYIPKSWNNLQTWEIDPFHPFHPLLVIPLIFAFKPEKSEHSGIMCTQTNLQT
jgi:hypothetical protein